MRAKHMVALCLAFLAACTSEVFPTPSASSVPSPELQPPLNGPNRTGTPVGQEPAMTSTGPFPTNGPVSEPHCQSRPQGSVYGEFAFASEDIYIIDADGSGLRQVTGPEYRASTQPAWSPDGQRLAFASSRYSPTVGAFDIFTIGSDGEEPRRITSSGGSEEHPAWSPDGSAIAYEAISDNGSRIQLFDTNGSSVTNSILPRTWNSFPSWSPRGDRVAFFGSDDPFPHGWDLLVYDLASREVLELTSSADLKSSDVTPWSTDGSQLVVAADRNGDSDIFTIDSETGATKQLTTGPGDDIQPAWSPDGARIAFVSNRSGNLDVYVMNEDGSGQVRVTDDPADSYDPRWSPDGSMIAYYAVTDQRYEVVVIDDQGCVVSYPTRAVSDLVEVPVWAPIITRTE
jgi:Tol biopolymer transport system component